MHPTGLTADQPTADESPILEIRHLLHAWPDRQKQPSQTLLDIRHFQLQAGERCFLHGPSGSGKSTLLNIIAGLCQPSTGEVWLAHQPLWRLSARQRDRLRATQTGVISQTLNLLPYLTVSDNLQLMQRFAGQHNDRDWQAYLLQQLNLSAQANQTVAQLSVGQQQRAAIARALVHRPALIIADEPTSALDNDNKDAFMKLLLQQCSASAASLLFVSHDLSLQPHFDRVLDIAACKPGYRAAPQSGQEPLPC
ncbi:MAG: ABC transporter ATP-binding protein [Saccharospirillaceae bacterium]|nr:ABC transporter ATP-binding protein [Saccharospirillaceae bacterium]